MDLFLVSKLVEYMLKCERRVSYRMLKRGLGLDDEAVEAIRDELVEVKRVAIDEGGKVLVWVGIEESSEMPEAQALTSEQLESMPVQAVPEKIGISSLCTPLQTALEKSPASVIQPEAERRQLTVMFCDMVGSTALSTQLDPEDLREVITSFQDKCRDAIVRYGGFVARYMGDGILVYFGYPKAHEDDAERAVRVGLEILNSVPGLNADVGHRYGVDVAVRIGVATGSVVVGDIIGDGASEEAAVLGETPNLAARLQNVAEPNQLVISPVTHRLVSGLFELDDIGEHNLKGISEPVRIWRVVSERDIESRFEKTDGTGQVPLVGRQEEMGLLLRAWEGSREGHGQVVLIQGEAGIGKSRLLEALREKCGDNIWLELRSSPYHKASTLYPVIEQLMRLLRLQPGDSVDKRLEKLEEGLRAYKGLPLEESVPLFGALLSLPVAEERYPALQMTPTQQRDATLDALNGWLTEEAERRPILTVWEDLHWADATTIEMLGLLIEQVPTVPMLVIGTFRPEFDSPWPKRSHITPITLNRLEPLESHAIVTNLAGGKSLPEQVLEHITLRGQSTLDAWSS